MFIPSFPNKEVMLIYILLGAIVSEMSGVRKEHPKATYSIFLIPVLYISLVLSFSILYPYALEEAIKSISISLALQLFYKSSESYLDTKNSRVFLYFIKFTLPTASLVLLLHTIMHLLFASYRSNVSTMDIIFPLLYGLIVSPLVAAFGVRLFARLLDWKY